MLDKSTKLAYKDTVEPDMLSKRFSSVQNSTEMFVNKARLKAITQEVNTEFTHDQTVVFLGKSSVTGIRETTNHDGTVNKTFELSPQIVDLQPANFDDEQKSAVTDPLVKPKSPSQGLRHLAFIIAQELGENEEDLYLHAIDVAREYLQDYRDNQMGVE